MNNSYIRLAVPSKMSPQFAIIHIFKVNNEIFQI